MNETWAQPKTLAEWRDRIMKTLGGSIWNEELDDQSLDHAIWQALALYNKYRPVWKWKPLGLLESDQQFDFSDEVNGVNVVDVKFAKNDSETAFSRSFRHHGNYISMSSPRKAMQRMVAHDRYDHFLGAYPVWSWSASEKKLNIVVKSTSMYASALLLVPNNIENISFHQEADFLLGSVGYARIILARILGKFGNIPAAQGDIPLDASSLASDGKAAVAEYEKILNRNISRMPPRPIFG